MHRSMPDPTKGGEASRGSLPDAGRLPRNDHPGIRQKSLLQVMQLMQLMQIPLLKSPHIFYSLYSFALTLQTDSRHGLHIFIRVLRLWARRLQEADYRSQ